jgi:uncharacterized repeat protein (TIGR01451 family)
MSGPGGVRRVFLRLGAVLIMSVAWVPAAASAAQADEGADLSVTAVWVGSGVPRAAVGETVTYAITLTNLGPGTASGASLRAATPDQFNPVSLTCSDASFCSDLGGELAAGATITATVVDVVCCFPKGDTRTTSAGATAVATTADPNPENNHATVATRIVGPYGFSFPG